MRLKKMTSLIVSLVFLGCAGRVQDSSSTNNNQTNYSRPSQGFLWVLSMNRKLAPDSGQVHYLSTGKSEKKMGDFKCSVQVDSEELDVKSLTMRQRATLDCGEKEISVTCETDRRHEPTKLILRTEEDGFSAVFGCDNGLNEIPPREVFPGTLILSSMQLEPLANEKKVRTTSLFPYKTEQNYSWRMIGNTDKNEIRTRIELTYEKAPKGWPGFPKELKVSADGKTASYERVKKTSNGLFLIGDDYHVAASDPDGLLRIRVFIEDHFAEEYWFRFLK